MSIIRPTCSEGTHKTELLLQDRCSLDLRACRLVGAALARAAPSLGWAPGRKLVWLLARRLARRLARQLVRRLVWRLVRRLARQPWLGPWIAQDQPELSPAEPGQFLGSAQADEHEALPAKAWVLSRSSRLSSRVSAYPCSFLWRRTRTVRSASAAQCGAGINY